MQQYLTRKKRNLHFTFIKYYSESPITNYLNFLTLKVINFLIKGASGYSVCYKATVLEIVNELGNI
jgi:hypothetical protein